MSEKQFSRLGNLNNMVDKLVKKSWVAMQNATKQRVTSQERAKLLALEKKRQASPELRTKLENDEMYERMTGNYSRMDLGVRKRSSASRCGFLACSLSFCYNFQSIHLELELEVRTRIRLLHTVHLSDYAPFHAHNGTVRNC